MTDDLKKIEELYHQALAKPKEERAAFLAEACAGDEALRRELQFMLQAPEKAGGFMELPALEHAARQAGQAGSQLLAGHQLGPFRIGPLLGRGGMGEVYRAVDTRLDRPVALKLLPAEVAGNPERLRRFTREAKAASSLNHPSIATIHEIGESDGIHWIAMELVEGQTLADRLQGHRMAMNEILEVGIQTAEQRMPAYLVPGMESASGREPSLILPANRGWWLTANSRILGKRFETLRITSHVEKGRHVPSGACPDIQHTLSGGKGNGEISGNRAEDALMASHKASRMFFVEF